MNANESAKIIDCDDWLEWDQWTATNKASSDNLEVQKRAHYRLGLLQFDNVSVSLSHFKQVEGLDPDFCKEQVTLRIAELLFKMEDIDNAIYRLAKVEGYMQT